MLLKKFQQVGGSEGSLKKKNSGIKVDKKISISWW